VEKNKLIKLAGVRYNPSTKLIKMSCESFETQAQNKRYLGDLVDVLIREAKDPQDTFEDVPFDFRHHKPKPVYEFPEEWKLTPERKRTLEERRAAKMDKEGQRLLSNKVVDGLLLTPTGQKDRQQYETLREEQIRGLEDALQKGSRARMVVPALLTLDRKSRGKKRVGAGKTK
jgi:hypothetical protein